LPAALWLLAISAATLAVTSLVTTMGLVSCSGISGCSVVQAPSKSRGNSRPIRGSSGIIADDVLAWKLPGGTDAPDANLQLRLGR
jgi:hypothetical protein